MKKTIKNKADAVLEQLLATAKLLEAMADKAEDAGLEPVFPPDTVQELANHARMLDFGITRTGLLPTTWAKAVAKAASAKKPATKKA